MKRHTALKILNNCRIVEKTTRQYGHVRKELTIVSYFIPRLVRQAQRRTKATVVRWLKLELRSLKNQRRVRKRRSG